MVQYQAFPPPTFDSFDSHMESSCKGKEPRLPADPSNVRGGDDLHCRSRYHWYGEEEKLGCPRRTRPT